MRKINHFGKVFANRFRKKENINMEEKKNNTAESEMENQAAEEQEQPQQETQETTKQPETEENSPEETQADPLADALKEIDALKDKYLRSVAEFDNYRKRTIKEKADLILGGSEKAVTAILPVIDDMERALQNGEKTEDAKVLKEGMELIYHKLLKVLEGLGVSKIETDDADFDTDFHEAIAMIPGVEDQKKGKVIDCVQSGYKLNDKVIRHAKVAVGQ